jgi:hypothetical protein
MRAVHQRRPTEQYARPESHSRKSIINIIRARLRQESFVHSLSGVARHTPGCYASDSQPTDSHEAAVPNISGLSVGRPPSQHEARVRPTRSYVTLNRDRHHSYLPRGALLFFEPNGFNQDERGAGPMYTAFKQLENGEFVRVASRDELEEAVQLVESLNDYWPGGYEVRESRSQMVRYATNFRSVAN